MGIRGAAKQLTRHAAFVAKLDQPVLVERYIEGREIYVGVLGNERLTVFPVVCYVDTQLAEMFKKHLRPLQIISPGFFIGTDIMRSPPALPGALLEVIQSGIPLAFILYVQRNSRHLCRLHYFTGVHLQEYQQ